MKKSIPPHVCVNKNWLAWFLITPDTLLESLGPRLPYQNLSDGYSMRRTYSFRHSFKTSFFKNLSNLQFLVENPWKWLSERLKIWKSPPPHVCDRRNRFTRHTVTPFNSTDTHGNKDIFESKFWILKSLKIFFRALEVKPSRFVESIFWWFKCDFQDNSS